MVPPIVSIIPKVEECLTYRSTKSNKQLFVPMNKSLVKKAQQSLKLKRDKPLVNKNRTLQSFMDLKIL